MFLKSFILKYVVGYAIVGTDMMHEVLPVRKNVNAYTNNIVKALYITIYFGPFSIQKEIFKV